MICFCILHRFICTSLNQQLAYRIGWLTATQKLCKTNIWINAWALPGLRCFSAGIQLVETYFQWVFIERLFSRLCPSSCWYIRCFLNLLIQLKEHANLITIISLHGFDLHLSYYIWTFQIYLFTLSHLAFCPKWLANEEGLSNLTYRGHTYKCCLYKGVT